MKRFLSYFFAAIVIFIVSSCATKSDIANLQGQIDEFSSSKITTIDQQITNIKASITSLQATVTQLSSFVSNLQLETTTIKADLAEKEKALNDRIDELKKYTDNEIVKNKNWVSATFCTLEQYQAVLTELADIKLSISQLDKDLRAEIEKAISESESSMKTWVNEQLAGYYTIAQMDVKLKALQDAGDSAQSSISKLEADFEAAKTELVEAYNKAITDAIEKHNGEITSIIAAEIKDATDNLQKQIDVLDARVSVLEGMIQSVSIIPAYSDGSVKAYTDGALIMNCIVSPASAVKDLTEENFKVYVACTVTKAASFSEVNVSSVMVDETTGEIEITTDLKEFMDNLAVKESLSVALNVKSGKNDYVSTFFCVSIVEREFIDLGLSVKWATCNLGASAPEKYGSFYQWAGTKNVSLTVYSLFWNTCPHHNGLTLEFPGWTKYNTKSSYGTVDNKTVIESVDDVAHVTLGGKWRIPTIEDWRELIENCDWVWTKQNGINGYKGTSKIDGYTDKTIFLPAAGYREDVNWDFAGSMGSYWSSSLNPDHPSYAYSNTFNSAVSSLTQIHGGGVYRYFGLSIRPVFE